MRPPVRPGSAPPADDALRHIGADRRLCRGSPRSRRLLDRRFPARRAGRGRDHARRRFRAAARHAVLASPARGARGPSPARTARVRVTLSPRDRRRVRSVLRARDDGGDPARARDGARRGPADDRRVRGPDRRPSRGGGGAPPRASGRFPARARMARQPPLAGRGPPPIRPLATTGAGSRRVGRDRWVRRRDRRPAALALPMDDALTVPPASSRSSLPSPGERARPTPRSRADCSARSGAGSGRRDRLTLEGTGSRHEGDGMHHVAAGAAEVLAKEAP